MKAMRDKTNISGKRTLHPKQLLAMIAALFVCAFVLAFVVPNTQAYAYYIYGTVEVETGVSYLTVDAGQSSSTSVTVTPASDDQTLGCGMAKCPQSCSSPGALESGLNCFDVNGNCTCAGTEYSTYYPELYVSSSNSAIATAVVSGGTVVVTGNSAGEAVITVSATLRQWTNNSCAINVTVNPADDASTVVSPSDVEVDVPQEAVVGNTDDEENNEVIIDTIAGRVYAVKITPSLDTSEYLSRIEGTNDQVIFWSGASYENPDYSWTLSGDDLDADSAYTTFDPTITISNVGTGEVANILMQANDGLALDFSHEGWLPGSCSIYVRVDSTYADGTKLNAYSYNTAFKKFELVYENLTVAGGYTSFFVDHCSFWALSTDDLTAYDIEETYTYGAVEENSIGEGNTTLVLAIAGGIVGVVVIIVVIALIVHFTRRRSRRAATEEDDNTRV